MLLTEDQKEKTTTSEGAYTFRPEFENGLNQYLYPYSQLKTDIDYQKGVNLDQYTIIYNKNDTKEQAVIKIWFSPKYFEQIIEFEVELNSIKISKFYRGRDVVVRWDMYDGFEPNKTFWTDTNGLAML